MNPAEEDIVAGARNLLLSCAGVKPGERILLVGELDEYAYFDPELCDDISRVAENIGIESTIIRARTVSSASQFPREVSDAMAGVDKTIFLSRLGDQVRFIKEAGATTNVMCYTLTRKHLGSAFASMHYKSMRKLHDQLVVDILASSSYRIEAACGTALTAELIREPNSIKPGLSEFAVELFPVMTFPPINCFNLTGRIVLQNFLLSSSTRQYANSDLILESPVIAQVENSRMVDFSGDQKEIASIRRQLERAAAITSGDPYIINSWHCGINPYTFFDGNPYADLEYWGTVAYGSPRYAHFHAAGNNPGDSSIQLFDASISFDGKLFWDQGKFIYIDRPSIQALFNSDEGVIPDSSKLTSIGI